MKKITMILLALVVVLTFGFMAISCDTTTGPDTNGGGGGNNGGNTGGNNGGGGVAKSIAGIWGFTLTVPLYICDDGTWGWNPGGDPGCTWIHDGGDTYTFTAGGSPDVTVVYPFDADGNGLSYNCLSWNQIKTCTRKGE